MQPIKELSFVAGWCAGRGCALIRQLVNYGMLVMQSVEVFTLLTVLH